VWIDKREENVLATLLQAAWTLSSRQKLFLSQDC